MKKIVYNFYLRVCYRDINEMPIWNWNRIQEGGSLFFLYKNKGGSAAISKKDMTKFRYYILLGFVRIKILRSLWRTMQEQYVEKFGFSDEFIRICRKQKEIILLRMQRVSENDKSLNALIKIAEDELDYMKKETGSGGDFWELKGWLDRAGYNIVPHQTSVTEFYSHVRTLTKQSKAQQIAAHE